MTKFFEVIIDGYLAGGDEMGRFLYKDLVKLTAEDSAALTRVMNGFLIEPGTRKHLAKLGLIDRLLHGDRVSKQGLRAMALLP